MKYLILSVVLLSMSLANADKIGPQLKNYECSFSGIVISVDTSGAWGDLSDQVRQPYDFNRSIAAYSQLRAIEFFVNRRGS